MQNENIFQQLADTKPNQVCDLFFKHGFQGDPTAENIAIACTEEPAFAEDIALLCSPNCDNYEGDQYSNADGDPPKWWQTARDSLLTAIGITDTIVDQTSGAAAERDRIEKERLAAEARWWQNPWIWGTVTVVVVGTLVYYVFFKKK